MRAPLLSLLLPLLVLWGAPEAGSRSLFSSSSGPRQAHLRRSSAARRAPARQLTHVTLLNDTHLDMTVQWAGRGTNIILCLAWGPQFGEPQNSSSAVYISYDAGDSFQNETHRFGTAPHIEKFYNHPQYPFWTVWTSVADKLLYSTLIEGNSLLVKPYNLSFSPSELVFSRADPKLFLVLDKEDVEGKLWLTRDFGASFVVVQSSVRCVLWSESASQPSLLYAMKASAQGNLSVVSTRSLFSNTTDNGPGIDDVSDFQVKGDFAFATKKIDEHSVRLFVSHLGSPFTAATFDSPTPPHSAYYVADARGSTVFVAASHENAPASLFVSRGSRGKAFALSMRRFACYLPTVGGAAVAELHAVAGLDGVYVACQLAPDGRSSESRVTLDMGNRWRPLQAPADDCRPTSSGPEEGCALQLTSSATLLEPDAQAAPVLSSESSPGLVLASGNHSGEPRVYLSEDGGVSWRQVLSGRHLYRLGAGGGALLALPLDADGAASELLYSTDAGRRWRRERLWRAGLRVAGVVAEEGVAARRHVFTAFGTDACSGGWLVARVDLRAAFDRNCSEADLETWAPRADYVGDAPCALGQREVLRRRRPDRSCLALPSDQLPRHTVACACGRRDFDCDSAAGFVQHPLSGDCVRGPGWSSAAPAAPASCPAGASYNRSRGYVRAAGSSCQGGQRDRFLPQTLPCPGRIGDEFLVLTANKTVVRMDLEAGGAGLVPLVQWSSGSAEGLELDVRTGCAYWSDQTRRTVERECWQGGAAASHEQLLAADSPLGDALSWDWVSGLLYLTDGYRGTIEVLHPGSSSTSPVDRLTLLSRPIVDKPRGVAVHPREGLLFWTDWSSRAPSVSRAAADGSGVWRLRGPPDVAWPNGIAVDFRAERIFWTDGRLDYVASADLDGRAFRKLVSDPRLFSHPFSIAVFKNTMYWTDWKKKKVYMADKDTGEGIRTLGPQLYNLINVKVFSQSLQVETNACASNVNGSLCSHMCVGMPDRSYRCLCPENWRLADNSTCVAPTGCSQQQTACADGRCVSARSQCGHEEDAGAATQGRRCGDGEFKCESSSECIRAVQRCDHKWDCADGSDERGCYPDACPVEHIECKSGSKCVPRSQWCDGTANCPDGSDERSCRNNGANQQPAEAGDRERSDNKSCKSWEMACDGRCIPTSWRCDGDPDCSDASDEWSCTTARPQSPGQPDFFLCPSGERIPYSWVCDGSNDCSGGADEVGCQKSAVSCATREFRCERSGRCLSSVSVCDGAKDCPDGEDEVGCESKRASCAPGSFECHISGRCVPKIWVCDGDEDCPNGEDEAACANITEKCGELAFRCELSGWCIPNPWLCDGAKDCPDGEDEADCENKMPGCAPEHFDCHISGRCVPKLWVCDGDKDCPNGADEVDCANASVTCGGLTFKCEHSGECLPSAWKCDGSKDCPDGTDEADCVLETVSCAPGLLECKRGGLCLNSSQLCDGTADCPDGEDEDGCPNKHVSCEEGEFKCQGNGSCLPSTKVCDGRSDCPDGGDELGCASASGSCAPGEFTCQADGSCLPSTQLCDGAVQCPDGSDEAACPSRDPCDGSCASPATDHNRTTAAGGAKARRRRRPRRPGRLHGPIRAPQAVDSYTLPPVGDTS